MHVKQCPAKPLFLNLPGINAVCDSEQFMLRMFLAEDLTQTFPAAFIV
jgi:hypothetical protein